MGAPECLLDTRLQMTPGHPYKRDHRRTLTIKGLEKELWIWIKARAFLEGKSAGELLNELMDQYRIETGWSVPDVENTSYRRDNNSIMTIRGIDRYLWRWTKSRAILEHTTASAILNELIHRYRREVDG